MARDRSARRRVLAAAGVLVVVAALPGCSPPTNDGPHPTAAASPAEPTGSTAPSSSVDPRSIGRRAAHTAIALPGGGVLVAGGCVVDGCTVATSGSAIVIPSGSRPTGPMQYARDAHTANLLPDGSVLVVGGFAGEGRPPTRTAERYRVETDTWVTVGSLRLGRGGHAAAQLGSGRIVVAGGWVSSRTYTASIEVFDPLTQAFGAGPDLPEAVDGLAAVTLTDGSVLITGGQRQPGVASSTAVVLSADGSQLTRVAPLLQARFKHTMMALPDGRVLVIGGTSDDVAVLSSTEIFDPRTRRFTAGPALGSGRYKLAGAAAALDDGRLVIGGGGPGTEVVDVAHGSVAPLPGAPAGVASFGTITAADGVLYLIGGYDREIRLSGTVLVLPIPA